MWRVLDRRSIAWLTAASGITLSAGLSVFFYLRTDLKPALAVFAGLLGVVITLQLEQRLLHDRPIGRDVEKIADARDSVYRSGAGPVTEDFADRILDECAVKLNALAAGLVHLSPEDEEWITPRITESTRHTLVATTLATRDDQEIQWWESPAAHAYLRRQAEASYRGVIIRRVFIYDSWTDAFDREARRQHALGIRTFRVRKDQLNAAVRIGLIIWDGIHGFELTFNPDGQFVHSTYTVTPHEIARLQRSFLRIEAAAEPWPPPAA